MNYNSVTLSLEQTQSGKKIKIIIVFENLFSNTQKEPLHTVDRVEHVAEI